MNKLSSYDLESFNRQKICDISNLQSLEIINMISFQFQEKEKKESFKNIISFLLKYMAGRKEVFNKDYYELEHNNIVIESVISKYKSYFPKTCIKKSLIHRNGVFAQENIKKGTLITFYPIHYMMAYGSNKLLTSTRILRTDLEPNYKINDYMLTGDEKELYIIVGHPKLYDDCQHGHMINHSDNPNTYYKLLNQNNCNIWGIISLKDIPTNTELTVNYGPRSFEIIK